MRAPFEKRPGVFRRNRTKFAIGGAIVAGIAAIGCCAGELTPTPHLPKAEATSPAVPTKQEHPTFGCDSMTLDLNSDGYTLTAVTHGPQPTAPVSFTYYANFLHTPDQHDTIHSTRVELHGGQIISVIGSLSVDGKVSTCPPINT